MKKILFLMMAVAITFAAASQNLQPSKLLKPKAQTILDKGDGQSVVPLKPMTLTDVKGIQRIPFGSSFNMLTLLAEENNNLAYNAELGIMMFTHRAGGAYGGQSGDMRSHFTPYFGSGIDSVVFTQQGNNRMRYPGGVIYNPTSNTNPDNAYAVISGPITDGSGWKFNFFCSQKLDGTSVKFRFEPLMDTFAPAYNNLTVCDGGKFFVGGRYATGPGDVTLQEGTRYIKKGQWQGDSVDWTSPRYKFFNNYKSRQFSNDTTPWAFNDYMAFSKDGMIGYYYVIGIEDVDPAINSGSKPIVWKTIDAGATWNRMPLVDLSTMNAKFEGWINPTKLTWGTGSEDYRPAIMCGSTVEEGNSPAVVDNNGNLHIACHIEGMFSKDLDSLDYTYAVTPWNIWDLHTTSTGWDVTLVDTIHAGIDESLVLTDQNLGHNYHIAKNADGTKIFFSWTDSPTEETNISPEIFVRGFDLTNGKSTLPIQMTNEMDYYFLNAAQQVVDSNGYYFLPCTFAVFSGSTVDAEPTHNFIKGIKIKPSDWQYVGIEENNTVLNTGVSMNPNPAKDFVNIDFNLNQTANVTVTAYNLLGSEVMVKEFGRYAAGINRVKLNIDQLQSGIYFFTLQSGSERVTKKIIVE